jgi:HEAT repeat protein
VSALLEKVAGTDTLDVRSRALTSLGDIGDPSCIPGLIALWERGRDGDDGYIQTGVSLILPRAFRSGEAYEPLVAALAHPNWNVRYYAIGTLQHMGDRRAREKIAPLVHDPNPVVRGEAERALEALR